MHENDSSVSFSILLMQRCGILPRGRSVGYCNWFLDDVHNVHASLVPLFLVPAFKWSRNPIVINPESTVTQTLSVARKRQNLNKWNGRQFKNPRARHSRSFRGGRRPVIYEIKLCDKSKCCLSGFDGSMSACVHVSFEPECIRCVRKLKFVSY